MLRVAALALVLIAACKSKSDRVSKQDEVPTAKDGFPGNVGAPKGGGLGGVTATTGGGGPRDGEGGGGDTGASDRFAAAQAPATDAGADAADPLGSVGVLAEPSGRLPADVSPRFPAYLMLLSADLYLDEMLAVFPGAPRGTRFASGDYKWHAPHKGFTAPLVEVVAKAAAEATGGAAVEPVDRVVAAYTQVAAELLPPLVDLHAYYTEQRFVDDEFDRGRREASRIAAWRSQLAKVRGALWTGVLDAWRAASFDGPDSPRAIVTRAWEACVRVGEAIVSRADRKRRDAAVSACRRSISSVAAVPENLRGRFDVALRETARALGDQVARDHDFSFYKIPREVREVTTKYLAMWSTLPVMPAERPAP